MCLLQFIIKDNSIVLTLPHIKAYMLQTLLGLEYLHAHWILHRVSFMLESVTYIFELNSHPLLWTKVIGQLADQCFGIWISW
jgi:hypothetical protein